MIQFHPHHTSKLDIFAAFLVHVSESVHASGALFATEEFDSFWDTLAFLLKSFMDLHFMLSLRKEHHMLSYITEHLPC